MPGYRIHISGSIVAGLLVLLLLVNIGVYIVEPQQVAVLTVLCVLGALFPDIDTDSKGKRIFYSGMLLLSLSLIYFKEFQWAAYLGILAMLPGVSAHRGWTHTWWAMLVVPMPMLVLPYYIYGQPFPTLLPYYVAFVTGYFSHLLLDREL
ncbi:metal-dependent hydrolase [Desulfovibrio sp. UCD-KL4C]|uniref:metal-dependent hydrolase n=1 Tax=Desulfovibrio sp. UCD-KL4C TaxID=2578120 RepID=UPI0025BEAC20|nr:metal-dependent hydrolase [Desulfovibrio sp. UCD-KL4C]